MSAVGCAVVGLGHWFTLDALSLILESTALGLIFSFLVIAVFLFTVNTRLERYLFRSDKFSERYLLATSTYTAILGPIFIAALITNIVAR